MVATRSSLGGDKIGWVSYNDPYAIWKYHDTFLYWHIVLVVWALYNLWSAVSSTNRGEAAKYVCFWIASLLNCISTEMTTILIPSATQVWHAQGVVMLFDAVPAATLLYGGALIFSAYVICEDLQLPWYIRPFPTAFLHVCCNLAFDATGLRFVWHTWHDTDPIAGARIWGHPIVNVIFQAGTAFFLSIFSNLVWERYFAKNGETRARKTGYLAHIGLISCGILAFPATVLIQIVPFFHTFQDVLHLPEEMGLFLLLMVYFSISTYCVFCKRIHMNTSTESGKAMARIGRRGILLFVVFLFFVWTTRYPAKQVSIGYHEIIGPCNETAYGFTPLGYRYEKRKYLCPSDMRDDRAYSLDYNLFPYIKDSRNETVEWYGVRGRWERGQYQSVLIAAACCGVIFLVTWGFVNPKSKTE